MASQRKYPPPIPREDPEDVRITPRPIVEVGPPRKRVPPVESAPPPSRSTKPSTKAGAIAAVVVALGTVLAAVAKPASDAFVAYCNRPAREQAVRSINADEQQQQRLAELGKRVTELEQTVALMRAWQIGLLQAQGYAVSHEPGSSPVVPVEITPPPKQPKRTVLRPKPEISPAPPALPKN